MADLLGAIRMAVEREDYVVSLHADDRCEERGITAWQVIDGLEDADLVTERPHTEPHPTVVVRELLADGSEVEVVWAYLEASGKAMLVTVYFPG